MRRRLLDLIVAEPGIRLPEAGRRLGCRPANIRYHFRVLIAAGLGELRKDKGILYLYPAKPAGMPVQYHQILTNSLNRAVVEVVAAQPGIPRGGIARALGVTTTRLNSRLDLMGAAGILHWYRGEQATLHHFATPQAIQALRCLEA